MRNNALIDPQRRRTHEELLNPSAPRSPYHHGMRNSTFWRRFKREIRFQASLATGSWWYQYRNWYRRLDFWPYQLCIGMAIVVPLALAIVWAFAAWLKHHPHP